MGSGPSWGGLLNAVEVDAFEYAVDALMVGGENRSCLSLCQTPSSFCLFHFDHGERKFIEISDPREIFFLLSMIFFPSSFLLWSFSSLVSPNRCNCARKRSRWWMPLTSVTRC